MAPSLPPLHGKTKLSDPNLVKKMCPQCKQKRDWVITRKKDGGYTKKCKVCGLTINVKRPASKSKR
jgi:hypothetical protein